MGLDAEALMAGPRPYMVQVPSKEAPCSVFDENAEWQRGEKRPRMTGDYDPADI